jgi:hypothetical protein
VQETTPIVATEPSATVLEVWTPPTGLRDSEMDASAEAGRSAEAAPWSPAGTDGTPALIPVAADGDEGPGQPLAADPGPDETRPAGSGVEVDTALAESAPAAATTPDTEGAAIVSASLPEAKGQGRDSALPASADAGPEPSLEDTDTAAIEPTPAAPDATVPSARIESAQPRDDEAQVPMPEGSMEVTTAPAPVTSEPKVRGLATTPLLESVSHPSQDSDGPTTAASEGPAGALARPAYDWRAGWPRGGAPPGMAGPYYGAPAGGSWSPYPSPSYGNRAPQTFGTPAPSAFTALPPGTGSGYSVGSPGAYPGGGYPYAFHPQRYPYYSY